MVKTTLNASVDIQVLIALEQSRDVDEFSNLSRYVEHILREYLIEKEGYEYLKVV